jgi:prophage regulatory protein
MRLPRRIVSGPIVSENRAARRAAASTKKPRRVLRLREVIARTGLSKSTIYLQITKGLFPAPAHLLSDKISVWDADEIDSVLEDAFAKRDEAVAQ